MTRGQEWLFCIDGPFREYCPFRMGRILIFSPDSNYASGFTDIRRLNLCHRAYRNRASLRLDFFCGNHDWFLYQLHNLAVVSLQEAVAFVDDDALQYIDLFGQKEKKHFERIFFWALVLLVPRLTSYVWWQGSVTCDLSRNCVTICLITS